LHYLRLHRSLMGLQSLLFSLRPELFGIANRSFLDKDFVYKYSKNPNPIVHDFYNSVSLQGFLIKHFEYKFEHHLLWADKSGMYFSLETRFPFLDHYLVENTLASGITINKGQTKYLLREAMAGILPEKVRNRVDKIGYQTPEMDWFNDNAFREYYLDVTHSNSFRTRKYLNKVKCHKIIDDFQKSGKYNKELWKWLSLELWMRKYIDRT